MPVLDTERQAESQRTVYPNYERDSKTGEVFTVLVESQQSEVPPDTVWISKDQGQAIPTDYTRFWYKTEMFDGDIKYRRDKTCVWTWQGVGRDDHCFVTTCGKRTRNDIARAYCGFCGGQLEVE